MRAARASRSGFLSQGEACFSLKLRKTLVVCTDPFISFLSHFYRDAGFSLAEAAADSTVDGNSLWLKALHGENTHTHVHTRTRTRVHTRSHIRSRARTRSHTRSYTHSCSHTVLVGFFSLQSISLFALPTSYISVYMLFKFIFDK